MEHDSFVEMMEELVKSLTIEMAVDVEEKGRCLSLIDMMDKD